MSMWGGGIQPPRPPFAAPPNSTPPPPPATSAGNRFRNSRQNELEALRQKGLAKLLNRHFTTVTKSIAEERAAADAALRDLEARKASTTEFVESSGGMGMYENLYMDLQAKKDELKRKERETLLLYQRYVNKFADTGVVAVPNKKDMHLGESSAIPTPSASCKFKETLPEAMTSPSSRVPNMATHIESNLIKLSASGGDVLPSAEVFGFDGTTYQAKADKEERRAYEHAMRTLEAKGVDAKYDPSRARRDAAAAAAAALRTEFEAPTCTTTDYGGDDDEDDMSALTDVASMVMSVAEERLVDYLRTETEEIRLMMEDEDQTTQASGSRSVHSGSVAQSQATLAAEKAEEMVRQMETMLRSITPQQKQKQEEEAAAHEPYEFDNGNPNEKWVVLWDPNHQREYYHETKQRRVQWEKPAMYDVKSLTGSSTSSQANVPRGGGDDVLSHMDVMPMVNRRQSRRNVYRQKQRRLRNRRLAVGAVAFLFTCVLAVCGYHKHQTDPIFAERVQKSLLDPLERSFDGVVGVESFRKFKHSLHQTFLMFLPGAITEEQEKKIREDAERRVLAEVERRERLAKQEAERQAKLEAERNATLEAERKAKLEAERKAKLEAERKAKEEKAAQEAKELARQLAEKVKKEAEAKALQEKKRKEAEEAKRREMEERRQLELRRPWHCNIPFTYLLNRRCRRLSKENPLFDLLDLINSMMQ